MICFVITYAACFWGRSSASFITSRPSFFERVSRGDDIWSLEFGVTNYELRITSYELRVTGYGLGMMVRLVFRGQFRNWIFYFIG